MQLIEAVPNISEGKNKFVIKKIAAAALQAAPVRLLHLDSNADANRTVLTLVGAPEAIVCACVALIDAAAKNIDMRFQTGAHPRLGATDVCPLVPVQTISLAETIVYADKLARQVADKLHIPVYLYEANAPTSERKNLAFIRQGEYESLPEKLKNFPPDYGPKNWSEQTAKTGATVIGARNFLIAFNMSLNTKDVQAARQIAAALREKNGGLPAVKAIGWYMKNYNCAQVSCNLTDFHKTSLALLFETCKHEASKLNLHITGSELIGLIPQAALLQTGQFYKPHETNTHALIRAAVKNLLLDNIRPFETEKRILEQCLEK